MRRSFFARLTAVSVLTLSLAACTRGCAGETELAFCDAVKRNDAAAAKALFDAGQINMLARDLNQTCEPGAALLEHAKPERAEFTALAVAFVKQPGMANACWTSPGNSRRSADGVVRSEGGGTACAIYYAVNNHNVLVVQALLDSGVSVTDNHARNAVYDAANQGWLDIVRLLVEKGGDPQAGLHVAQRDRRVDVVEYLESKGAKEDVPPLLVAARRGDLPAVDAAIAARADLNAVDQNGRTPLYRAALYGHVEVVTRLARAGANLEIMTTEEAWTPLHVAANENRADVIRALAAAKAVVDVRKDAGYPTPLMVAVQNQAADAVKALLAVGADANTWTQDETTAVRRAALYGHYAMVKALLDAGARVNEPHGPSWQPVLHAVVGLCGPLPAGDTANDYYRVTVMNALLAAGADPVARNAEGKTPREVVEGLLAGTQEPFYRACYQAKLDALTKPPAARR